MSYTGNKDIYVANDGFVYTDYEVALSAQEESNKLTAYDNLEE